MIVGRGDIASVLPDSDLLFFASGVSNSAETRASEFNRESSLLMSQSPSAHLVYFSSLCIFTSSTPYARHKWFMEGLVKSFPSHTIIRLGNITWGTNPHTLLNHLRSEIVAGRQPVVQDVYRYLVDRDEFLHWISLIPPWPCEMNVTGRRMRVADIVDEIRAGVL
jgi:hypothetical protein